MVAKAVGEALEGDCGKEPDSMLDFAGFESGLDPEGVPIFEADETLDKLVGIRTEGGYHDCVGICDRLGWPCGCCSLLNMVATTRSVECLPPFDLISWWSLLLLRIAIAKSSRTLYFC